MPLSSFNTGGSNVLASSATQSVKQPFHDTRHWNTTGGFQFGAVTSQPLGTTMTPSLSRCQPPTLPGNAAVSHSSVQSAADAVQSDTELSSSVHSTTSDTTAATSQQCGVFASMPVSRSKMTVDVASSDAAETSSAVASSAASVAAAAECGTNKSVEFSVTSLNSSSVAVISTTSASLTSETPPVFSVPLTTFSHYPSSLFAFGQSSVAPSSSRPLGVPSTSASQLNAQLGTGL